MTNTDQPAGKTIISTEVLVNIAKFTALSMPGVNRMAPISGGINRLFRRALHEGVRIEIEDNTVFADLHLVLNDNINIREVSRDVQEKVTRAIQEMVGMDVGQVNIHIEDINFEGSAEA